MGQTVLGQHHTLSKFYQQARFRILSNTPEKSLVGHPGSVDLHSVLDVNSQAKEILSSWGGPQVTLGKALEKEGFSS